MAQPISHFFQRLGLLSMLASSDVRLSAIGHEPPQTFPALEFR